MGWRLLVFGTGHKMAQWKAALLGSIKGECWALHFPRALLRRRSILSAFTWSLGLPGTCPYMMMIYGPCLARC